MKNSSAPFVVDKINDYTVRLCFEDDIVYTVDDLIEISKHRRDLLDEKHYLLIDIRNAPKATSEARVYMGSNDIAAITSGMALIVDGFLSKVLGNFYMKFNEGKYPTKTFYTEEEALLWINSLKSIE